MHRCHQSPNFFNLYLKTDFQVQIISWSENLATSLYYMNNKGTFPYYSYTTERLQDFSSETGILFTSVQIYIILFFVTKTANEFQGNLFLMIA